MADEGFWKHLAKRFDSVDRVNYWFKFILKFPERFISGVTASVITYLLLKLVGL